MAEYEKRVREQLDNHRCIFKRHGKGEMPWYSPITQNTFPVAMKIKSRHMANGIMKQAGIDFHF
jgi:hypothetical protein